MLVWTQRTLARISSAVAVQVKGLASVFQRPVGGLTLGVGLIAVVVGFGAWWTYFDFAGHRPPRRGPAATLQWLLGHLPLAAAIAAMGAAMVSLADHAHDGRTPTTAAWVLCAGRGVHCGWRGMHDPLVLGLALVLLLSIPWVLAVAHRLRAESST
jgi:hypothetical protein